MVVLSAGLACYAGRIIYYYATFAETVLVVRWGRTDQKIRPNYGESWGVS